MTRRDRPWWSSSAGRGIATVASATGVGQIINLTVTPILSRLYSPEAFGTYAYVIAIATVLGLVAGFKLENAIPLAASDREAGIVLRVGLLVALCTTFVALVVSAMLAVSQPSWAGNIQFMWLLYVCPLALLTYAYTALSQAALRYRRYKAIAQRNLVQVVGTGTGQVAGGLSDGSAAGLLWGQALGRVLALVGLTRATPGLLHGGLRVASVGVVFRKYWRFPLMFTPAVILNTLGSYLPLFLIGHWFGLNAAGNLAMAERALVLPSAIIGVAVGQVMVGEVAERVRSGKGGSSSLYLRASSKLAPLGLTLGVACYLLSPFLFPWILGDDWAAAGEYARAMSLALTTGFVASPLSSLFYVFQGALHQVALDIARPTLVILMGWVGFRSGADSVSCVWLMYLTMAAVYSTTWYLGLLLARRSDG